MWDIKYRPRKYSDVLGQDGSVRLLKTRVSNGTAFDTSYIFAGGYGRGKTTLSRIHAMAMLCQDLDKRDPEPCGHCDNCRDILIEQSQAFTERDAASNGSADAMRAIVDELPYVLENAIKRIYLIDEFQRTSPAAQDVLLKPMEEKLFVAMLATTEAEKIRGAIRSRCEEYTIRKVTREDILPRMKMVLETEGVQYVDDAVLIIIDRAEGHVRNVLNNLEMVAQLGAITVESVREYLHLSVITLYYEILLHLDQPLKAIECVNKACEMVSPDEVASGLAEAAMNCYRMARKCHVDFSYVDRALAEQVYNRYQDNVVRFAKWFTEQRNVTRLKLELDVLAFSMNAGNLPGEVHAAPAPVVVVAPPVPAPVSIPVSRVTSVPAAATAPAVKATVPAPAAPALAAGRDPYTDPTEPTVLEGIATGSPLPRMRPRGAEAAIQSQPQKQPKVYIDTAAFKDALDLELKRRKSLREKGR